jgi:hypothetical protein
MNLITVRSSAEDVVVEQAEVATPLPTYTNDIQVSKILTCELHPDADSLCTSGTSMSGGGAPNDYHRRCVKFMPVEADAGTGPSSCSVMRHAWHAGASSHGMVLCAGDERMRMWSLPHQQMLG